MSVKVTLDTGAIRHLMESDPQFAVDIKKAVLKNIISDVTQDNANTETKKFIKECIKENHMDFIKELENQDTMNKYLGNVIYELKTNLRTNYINKDKLSQDIKEAVWSTVSSVVRDLCTEHRDRLHKELDAQFGELRSQLDARALSLTNAVDVEWKKQAINVIKEDVKQSLQHFLDQVK